MEDAFAPTRSRIKEICGDFEVLSKELAKPRAFMRADQFFVNEQVCEIFTEAANILKAASIDITVLPKEIESPLPQVSAFREKIDELNAELDRRTRAFDSSVGIARQIFTEKLDQLESEYKGRLKKLAEKNASEEKELERSLKEIQKTFDEKLHDETAVHVKERTEMQGKLVKLKQEFAATQSNLSASLASAKTRAELLEKQKAMLEETNEQVTSTIAEKFKQQLEAMQSQCAIRIETLEKENKRLRHEINASEVSFKVDIERLSRELETIEETQKENLEAMMNKQLLSFEKKKRKMEAQHQRVISDIAHQIEMEEMSSSNEAQLLRTEIEQQKKALAEADERFETALSALHEKTEVELLQRENEMKLMAKMHAKTMKQIEQKHKMRMEQEIHDAEKSKYALEQKLQQTQREGEATRKRLETELTALNRAKAKFEEEMKEAMAETARRAAAREEELREQRKTMPARPPLTARRTVDADVSPTITGRKPEVEEELQSRVAKFTDAGKMELAAISKAMESVEQQFKSEQTRLQLRLDDIDRQRAGLEAEKQRLNNRLSEAQTAIDLLKNPKEKPATDNERELNAQIAAQYDTITKLKEELQQCKEETKKVDISVIQAEHEAEVGKLREQLALLEAENQSKVDEIRARYEAQIEQERKEAEAVVASLNARYEETMREIKRTQENYKEESLRDHQKWMATRKEMADSNNRILGALQARDNSRPTSSSVTRVSNSASRASPLPVLKR